MHVNLKSKTRVRSRKSWKITSEFHGWNVWKTKSHNIRVKVDNWPTRSNKKAI